MSHSTKRPSAAKSPKLPEGFPLWKHPSGRWCKKVRGKAFYFGKVADDPEGQAALERWLNDKDDLLAGRRPRRKDDDALTVGKLVNLYLSGRQAKVKSGELAERTFITYKATCSILVDEMGAKTAVADLRPSDFAAFRSKLAERFSLLSMKVAIAQVRTVFKWGHDSELLEKPVRFGPEFKPPKESAIRKVRHANGERIFEAAEVRAMLAVASVQFRAMILLACNAAYGNTDLALLSTSVLDLENGWATFPRPKTQVPRRAALWPETVAAIREVLAIRPKPRDPADNGLVFITKHGKRWVRVQRRKRGNTEESTILDSINDGLKKVMKRANVPDNGRTFYRFRHLFETIAGETLDQAGVDHVMGHSRGDMASVYRERISDERLKAISDHVHGWLFGREGGAQ